MQTTQAQAVQHSCLTVALMAHQVCWVQAWQVLADAGCCAVCVCARVYILYRD